MAIIGFGGMGSWHLRKLTEHLPTQINVVGAYEIREEAQQTATEKGLKLYASPQEIYNDPSINLVLIATPNDSQKTYAIACLEAGKNVICEKPVTMNTPELDEILAVANRTGKLFTVHQNRRWDRDFLTMRNLINSGQVTNLYRIETRVQGSRQWVHGWRGYKVNGGGMVLDWGIHLFDQILLLFPQKITSVHTHFHNIVMPEVEDDFTALLQFEDGLSAVVNVSMSSFIPQPRWHLFFKEGSAKVQTWGEDGTLIKLADPNALDWSEDIVYTAAGPTRSMAPRPASTVEEITLPLVEADAIDFYKNIIDVLENGAAPIVTHAQIRRVMTLIDTVFQSAQTGASVSCSI